MGVSTIAIAADALDTLSRMGVEVDDRMYSPRPDGRFDLRVSDEVRAQFDGFVVRHGYDYSTAIKVWHEAARRAAPVATDGEPQTEEG